MVSKVFAPPTGLQSLLGGKALTSNPAELEASLRAVVDLTPFYLFGAPIKKRIVVPPLVLALAEDVASRFTVPEGKCWIPTLQVVSYSGAGAVAGRAKPCVVDNLGSVIFGGDSGPNTSSVSGYNLASVAWFQSPVIIPAGYSFSVWVEVGTATGLIVSHVLHYVELDV